MSAEAMIDASLFMGMHSTDDTVRGRCKSFFAQRLTGRVSMSLEHVGFCDNLVWSYPRAEQDAYYPFMDVLHTDMRIDRIGYEETDLKFALDTAWPPDLPWHERLLLAMATRLGAVVHTASSRLTGRTDLPAAVVSVLNTAQDSAVDFPEPLERLYADSLALRVAPERV
ncbi:DUF6190 family protein [Nocardia sp. NRRL S-836]|uniref:DUF6190 family protein n=1 Tax=Nocardia sp. NRRL S-836 TaxID=1519492 RepID=UPI0006ADF4A7|nr:DUF6190 family protein [Nocardia sp. NRRL S-836]KOV84130.1 hypothetical protein ADL03_17950 [Nocardia sp. NRRL S-836]